jgi:hypothetical protein
MPEAIATTKRKFYKALDAFTNRSQASLEGPADARTSSANPAGISSSQAFDEARERARKRLRSSTSSSSLPSLAQHASVARGSKGPLTVRSVSKTSDQNKTPPNFSPWSQELFLARLQSFSSVSKWHPKPDAVNEVIWAKRGWSCVDVNTVACRGGCDRRIFVDLSVESKVASGAADDDDDDDDDAEGLLSLEAALVEKYQGLVVQGHADSCLWFKAGCKDDIHRLQVVRPSIWQPELRKRFLSLLEIDEAIVSISIQDGHDDAQDSSPVKTLLDNLPSTIISQDDGSKPPAEKALNIALRGWRGSVESGNQLLHCDACFQRIGLWMYQPEYIASHREQDDTAENREDDVPESHDGLDLIELHREHCPWRNANSQCATGSLHGLNASQILHRIATTCARDNRRRSNDKLGSAVGEQHADDDGGETDPGLVSERPATSREEVARQDKERESRLRKLKNLFNIKRRAPKAVSRTVV